MSSVLTSSDVAVWLRFQIAAGRLEECSDPPAISALARKLGVRAAVVSAAYDQLRRTGEGTCGNRGMQRFSGQFDAVADLVDQIVALDRPDTENQKEI